MATMFEYKFTRDKGTRREVKKTYRAYRWAGWWWSWHGVRRNILDLLRLFERREGMEDDPFFPADKPGTLTVHHPDGSTTRAAIPKGSQEALLQRLEEISDERDR